MKRDLYLAIKIVAVEAFIVLLVFCCILVRRVDSAVEDSRQLMAHEQRRIDALVDELTLTTKQARLASTEERQYLASLNKDVTATVGRVNQVLVSAQHTLDTTSASVAAVKPLLEETQKTMAGLQPVEAQATADLAALEPTEEQLRQASVGANRLFNDPQLAELVANLNGAAVETRGAAAEVRGMATDGHAVTAYYRKVITTPKKWFQVGWMGLLEASYYLRNTVF
ncbi:MAG TPA: hypothetical protein VKU60_15700 [Chloroflexota bacterium]|nr:hypothetical protein [Chloroflexota bacterium]